MKNLVKATLAITIIISLVLAVASCGGGGSNPKSLAKQAVDLMVEMQDLNSGDPKYDAAVKKLDALTEKVGKLWKRTRKSTMRKRLNSWD